METYTEKETVGELVDRAVPFIISVIFKWSDERKESKEYTLSTMMHWEIGETEGVSNIYCTSEREMLRTFTLLMLKYKPDIITGYNDNGFDWPVLLKRLQHYRLMEGECGV
jgi:DNA polymerase elongation subunit (family B)